MPVGALLGEDDHADDTTRAAVPLDSLGQRTLHEVDGVGLLHALFPVRITVSVDVRRTGPADGVGLLV